MRTVVLVVIAIAIAGCGGAPPVATGVTPVSAGASSIDRMTLRRGDQRMEVDSPLVAGRQVERLAQQAGGYIEEASGSSDGRVSVLARVPAARLEELMDSVKTFGRERHRQLTGRDVTDQYVDLEARLRSSIALRDRLQQLLGRAESLDDVLKLEQQIARLQSEIDGLQARLDQLRSGVALATLSVSFEQGRVLGPLGVVGKGLARGVSWLFVIK